MDVTVNKRRELSVPEQPGCRKKENTAGVTQDSGLGAHQTRFHEAYSKNNDARANNKESFHTPVNQKQSFGRSILCCFTVSRMRMSLCIDEVV